MIRAEATDGAGRHRDHASRLGIEHAVAIGAGPDVEGVLQHAPGTERLYSGVTVEHGVGGANLVAEGNPVAGGLASRSWLKKACQRRRPPARRVVDACQY